MNNSQEIKDYIYNLRKYLEKNSINENTSKQIEFLLKYHFIFLTSLTFKKRIDSFLRITINKRVNEDGREQTINEIKKLKYPPDGAKTNGRANLIGEKILYGTDNIISSLKEVRAENNDVITISTWKLKSEKALTITPIFKNFPYIYNESFNLNFIELKKEYDTKLNQNDKYTQDSIDLFVQFLSDCFSKQVHPNNNYDYFLSSYYANRLFNFLQNGEIDCILYPSVQDDFSGINIAMKHDVFDTNYKLEQVQEKIVLLTPQDVNSYCELAFKKSTKSFTNEAINW